MMCSDSFSSGRLQLFYLHILGKGLLQQILYTECHRVKIFFTNPSIVYLFCFFWGGGGALFFFFFLYSMVKSDIFQIMTNLKYFTNYLPVFRVLFHSILYKKCNFSFRKILKAGIIFLALPSIYYIGVARIRYMITS